MHYSYMLSKCYVLFLKKVKILSIVFCGGIVSVAGSNLKIKNAHFYPNLGDHEVERPVLGVAVQLLRQVLADLLQGSEGSLQN